jgi:Domain of unknown function (DUF1929)
MLCSALLAAPAIALPQAPAPGAGSWSPLYDWRPQLQVIYTTIPQTQIPHTVQECKAGPISHAALIPTGVHRGKILLWHSELFRHCPAPPDPLPDPPPPPCDGAIGGVCGPTQRTWIFDPSDPTVLLEIRQLPLPFTTNIFCSGTSWDADGNLVVAGGEDIVQFTGSVPSAGSYPKAAYRFHPGVFPSSPTGADPYPYVVANPWEPLGNMSIKRNYPNLVPLIRLGFLSNCSTGPLHLGGGALVIGGRPEYTEGNEIWDFLNTGGTAWSCALAPLNPLLPAAYPHPFTNHAGGLSQPALYEPVNQGSTTSDYPELDLESYPKAHQLSTGEILIAGDRDKISPAINSPALTWSITPHYSNVDGQASWRLYRSKPASADRQWGTGALMHMRDGIFEHHDRYFAIGGGTAGAAPTVLDTVDEFVPDAILGAKDGDWDITMAPMNHQRWQLNAVTLPTGQLFIHGGDGPHAAGFGPVYTPEIYEPGRPWELPPASATPNATYDVAQHPVQLPRGQHHVTVLLPDARVFMAGGDWQDDPTVLNPKHTGAIYSPWYLDLGFRPQILRSASNVAFNPVGSSANKFELKVRVGVENTVKRVVLIRPAAVTHHYDNDQRYIELAFTVLQGEPPPPPPPGSMPVAYRLDLLEVTAPEETLGPAGWYMLFAIEERASDSALAPSVAVFVDVQ